MLPNSFSKSIPKLVLASQYIRFPFLFHHNKKIIIKKKKKKKKKKRFIFFGKPVQKIVGFTIIVLLLFENKLNNVGLFSFELLVANAKWRCGEYGRTRQNKWVPKVTFNCFSVIFSGKIGW